MTENAVLLARVQAGQLIEADEVSEEYRQLLIETLTITADTELLGALMHYDNLYHERVPEPFVGTLLAITQDEFGHAHIAYRLLEDLGVDIDYLLWERPAQRFKHPYAMDMLYTTFAESALIGFLQDRAGFHLLGDVYRTTSYAPWKRALAKVDREEVFHMRFGERAVTMLARSPEGRQQLQQALDWMFPITVEWFGQPDHLKRRDRQLEFRLKSKTNDQLRQDWLAEVVPFLTRLGLRVPAHYDESQGAYVLDYPFPCRFLPEEKRWDFSAPVSWEEVRARWRQRGPYNEYLVQTLRTGRTLLTALQAAGEVSQ
uniref:Phenylacetate-CoA oxygenase subunit PaaA n=1 Tax=Thermogemmatispora argillosa TaxID=2045280 RepID=A0A455T415_9CHLR|nr:phenylacetate-CoA oxygenase subunit PaaA [Thermogemmatispora argillosa]